MALGMDTTSAKKFSIAHIRKHWYIAATSSELRDRPLARSILGVPLVIFRSENGPAALLDRCAHRNAPLSLGRISDSHLVCAYHGWAFDHDGICQKIPALCGPQTGKARRVPRFLAKEQDGYIWVYLEADSTPSVEPFRPPEISNKRYSTVRYESEFDGTLHATLENILDVPHTPFVHRGLFRGATRNPIDAVVRRGHNRVEAEFIGEPRPSGVVGRLLAPGGGIVTHFDRFFLPSVAQVEYKLGDASHIIVNSILTPVSDFLTKLYAVVSFRTRLPAFAVKLVVMPLAKAILKQDKVILRKQLDNLERFGGERYVSTEVDLLGPHIWRLLKKAERGDTTSESPTEERVQLLA